MKKKLAAALALAALVAGTVAYGDLTSNGPGDPIKRGDRAAGPHARGGSPEDGRSGFGPRSTTIARLEIGMRRAEVLAIAGSPDREEVMSTDFGHDVTLWYGSWEVWLSHTVVQSINYYPKV